MSVGAARSGGKRVGMRALLVKVWTFGGRRADSLRGGCGCLGQWGGFVGSGFLVGGCGSVGAGWHKSTEGWRARLREHIE